MSGENYSQMKPAIVGKVISVEPDTVYQGVTHTQFVSIQCDNSVINTLDSELLVDSTYIGKSCEVGLECFLGIVSLQGEQTRKGIDIKGEHRSVTLYGVVVDKAVETFTDPNNPCREFTLLLDVGKGTLQCFLIDSPNVDSDFYKVPELEIGSYIALLSGRIDLKEIGLSGDM
jgi:hypothetical protein